MTGKPAAVRASAVARRVRSAFGFSGIVDIATAFVWLRWQIVVAEVGDDNNGEERSLEFYLEFQKSLEFYLEFQRASLPLSTFRTAESPICLIWLVTHHC